MRFFFRRSSHVQGFGAFWLANRRRYDFLAETPLPQNEIFERRNREAVAGGSRAGIGGRLKAILQVGSGDRSSSSDNRTVSGSWIRSRRGGTQNGAGATVVGGRNRFGERLVAINRRLPRAATQSAQRSRVTVDAAIATGRPLVMVEVVAHRL